MADFLASPAGDAALTLLIAAVTSGLILGLAKLGPDRRKLGADSELSRANAAAALTGSALSMVTNAQQERDRAVRAEQRAWRRVYQLEAAMRDAGVAIPHDDEQEEP